MGVLAAGRAVALLVLGSADDTAVVVAEIPCGTDEDAADGHEAGGCVAVDQPGLNPGLPPRSRSVVCRVVPTLLPRASCSLSCSCVGGAGPEVGAGAVGACGAWCGWHGHRLVPQSRATRVCPGPGPPCRSPCAPSPGLDTTKAPVCTGGLVVVCSGSDRHIDQMMAARLISVKVPPRRSHGGRRPEVDLGEVDLGWAGPAGRHPKSSSTIRRSSSVAAWVSLSSLQRAAVS